LHLAHARLVLDILADAAFRKFAAASFVIDHYTPTLL
jgi:hypothetical protein